MGHTYVPIFRLTPLAGDQSTLDISAWQWVNVAQPEVEPVFTEKELLTRGIVQTRYGYRCSVRLELTFITPDANETTFAETILDRAMNDDWEIELSLDGGTTYRKVQLTEFQQVNIEGKNIGVIYSMVWVCEALLTTKPPVASGSW